MKIIFVTSLSIALCFVSLAQAETEVLPTSYPTAPAPSTGGTNNTSKSASGSAGMAQMATAAAGAAAMMKCSPKPPGPYFCAVGAANLAASMMMGGGSDNAGDVANETQYGTGGGSGGSSTPGAGYDKGNGGGFPPEVQALAEQVKNAGYGVSPDGQSLTLPSGQTVPFSQVGNVPGYESTPEAQKQMEQIEAAVMQKASGARVVGVGTVDGGGGGAGGSGYDTGGGGFSMAKYLKGLRNRDPSSVSGLSKKLGEDNIGIKSDNIFEMVSRQYKRKQSQSAFLK